MVDPMHQEMKHEENWLIGKPLVDVEQEPMHCVFQNGPDDISEEETNQCLRDRVCGDEGYV